MLYKRKEKIEAEREGCAMGEDERTELKRLRHENKTLRMEKEIVKKSKPVLRKGNKIEFIRVESVNYPISVFFRMLQVSTCAYYAWDKRPVKVISADTLHLYRRVKELLKQSRGSLGNREMVKKLRVEGNQIGRYKTRKIMAKLGLKVTQRLAV